MRRTAAILAIVLGVLPVLAMVIGFDLTLSVFSGIVSIALVVSAVVAWRGGDLIYLAAAWGTYLGLNFIADYEVASRLASGPAPELRISAALLIVLAATGVSGLALTFLARRKEA